MEQSKQRIDLNRDFSVRRSEKEKERFREAITAHLSASGMHARTEITKDGKNRNIVVGDPETAEVILTAHYDTPAAALFPNLMIPRCKPLYYICQMIPILLILALSLAGGYGFSLLLGGASAAFLLGFLVLYYGIYFLGFRTFSNRHNANDNTSGVLTLLDLCDRLGAEGLRHAAVILFDNEEKGKKGSKAYAADHADAIRNTPVLHFDCVRNGTHAVLIVKDEAREHRLYSALEAAFSEAVKAHPAYTVAFYPMKGSESNSDYKNFPCGIGAMACKRNRFGLLYTPWIHTPWDTVSSPENTELFTDAACAFVRCVSERAFKPLSGE
jgi:hypothetical protein